MLRKILQEILEHQTKILASLNERIDRKQSDDISYCEDVRDERTDTIEWIKNILNATEDEVTTK